MDCIIPFLNKKDDYAMPNRTRMIQVLLSTYFLVLTSHVYAIQYISNPLEISKEHMPQLRTQSTEANQKLTQAQYDQQIERYTAQVNATKLILDDPNAQSDASAQKQAFCSRIDAYRQIAELSKQNLELDMASSMLMIAKNFIERQHQSLVNSGMTEQVFCGSIEKK